MDVSEQVLRVVRGQFRWTELDAGLVERSGAQQWSFPPAAVPPVQPSAKDIALGLKAFAPNPKELREWASFVLAASPLLSFEKLEESPEGEALIEALWDLSNGEPADALDLPRLIAGADE